ncbi:hypothetical protein AOQ84DRAFT_137166 [Glonium stellatum]|uniref:Uncharacterized protein n=1 Tax=Glonium stellatum TaxID=574774 RepID=A0A8E2ES09_9PEZI|nr:hypothetical protein AOQ84DRAFT_137166 [Glonium stellatum]
MEQRSQTPHPTHPSNRQTFGRPAQMLERILAHLTGPKALLALLTLYLVRRVVLGALEARRIRRLGQRAAVRRTYLPLGIDMLCSAISHALADRNYEFWLATFARYGNPANPWTVEAGRGAARVVFTADPENIKALLATQFRDYGKGAIFNRDWHDFLGDSELVFLFLFLGGRGGGEKNVRWGWKMNKPKHL